MKVEANYLLESYFFLKKHCLNPSYFLKQLYFAFLKYEMIAEKYRVRLNGLFYQNFQILDFFSTPQYNIKTFILDRKAILIFDHLSVQ